jgi:ubiquinone biosynthesis protein UbiJ
VSGLLATIGCHRVADLINRALRYDPATRAMLARLDRKTLRLECDLSPLPLPAPVLTLAFHTDGVELEPGEIDAPTLRIRGSASSFVAMLNDADPTTRPTGLDVQGDHELLVVLRQQLRSLDIDWEAVAAQLLGDVPAHLLGQSLRNAQQWQRDIAARARVGITEFAREETRLITPLRTLSAGAERLAAALNALSARVDPDIGDAVAAKSTTATATTATDLS